MKLVTKLGTDHFAEIAENTMEQLGMDRSGVFVTEECDTGCALILVGEDSGQNEIVVVVPGACLTFSGAGGGDGEASDRRRRLRLCADAVGDEQRRGV